MSLPMQEINSRFGDRWLKVELFSAYHHITGEVLTNELRTFGLLNSAEPQLLLKKVATNHLLQPMGEDISSGFAHVAKSSIFLALPNDEHETDRLERAAKIYSRGELLQRRALVVVGNFEISGNLHLSPEIELDRVFMFRNEQFIGITDVTIRFLPNLKIQFSANSALINRAQVDFLCAGAP